MDRSVFEIADGKHKKLVDYQVHGALRRRREMGHGHVRIFLEKAQTDGR